MKKILIVDDAKIFVEVEKALFTRTGAQIFTATSGTEGLRQVMDEMPDIVLLDLVLPDIPGDRVCAQIKSNPATASIPVIMVTTVAKVDDIERCRKAGCDDYVTKPLHYAEMLAKVAGMLNIPQRVSRRLLVRMESEIDNEPRVFFGNSLDISTSGMLIETGQYLSGSQELSLRFYLHGKLEFAARAKIMRAQKAELGKFRYGVQFLELADSGREAIASFLESR